MKTAKISALNLPEAWFWAIKNVYEQGDEFSVEKGSELTLTRKLAVLIDVEHPEMRPLLHESAPCDLKYIENNYLSYLFEAERKPNESYTYGQRLREPVDQISEVIRKFREFRMDRQNTMVLRRPEDMSNPDPPCLTLIDTEILEGKLNLFVYFRSWDCFAGLPANLAAVQYLNEYMALEIGADPGKIVAFSKNLHLYKRQFSDVEKIIYKGLS